jgi:phosphatidylserine/phosphatidylglycerophosphate/cardiolipin synthase-like enzyme
VGPGAGRPSGGGRLLQRPGPPDATAGQPRRAGLLPHPRSARAGPDRRGTRLTLLLNGEQIYPAILEAIRRARTTITYAQYSYEDGEIARKLAEAMAERCRAGVKVHVLLDTVGTASMPRETPS